VIVQYFTASRLLACLTWISLPSFLPPSAALGGENGQQKAADCEERRLTPQGTIELRGAGRVTAALGKTPVRTPESAAGRAWRRLSPEDTHANSPPQS
jgi:hypothetical protein